MQTLEATQQVTQTPGDIAPKLELTRLIRAPRAKVFAAWTNPEILRQWFAPGNMVVPEATLDVRKGGEYAVEMRGSKAACEGKAEDMDMSHKALVRGVYQRVTPNELLEFTWCGDWDLSETSVVTVTLADAEGGTLLTLRHEKFASERSRNGHNTGWSASLSKLAHTLEN